MDRNNRFRALFPGTGGLQHADPAPLRHLSIGIEPLNQEVNRVVIRAEAPHPGYGIRVMGIYFSGGRALIYVEAVRPDPSVMHPQVISAVQTVTYIDNTYTPLFPPEYEKYISPWI
ncbi:hypothetical protein AWM70_11650 [Paenibacillus yonginensis]|uniref:PrcB C-terminal domain-containing protein n=1 Tax=Paenibacillus yonginensis TaxID=1462996 RepID=A0A1B1N191_9BACL|nr:hypothetical protein [Paenibacillus yonginensis]ANS75176.1 hypothetical protein AWM70_11650 [Paenibacillus yonginensis]